MSDYQFWAGWILGGFCSTNVFKYYPNSPTAEVEGYMFSSIFNFLFFRGASNKPSSFTLNSSSSSVLWHFWSFLKHGFIKSKLCCYVALIRAPITHSLFLFSLSLTSRRWMELVSQPEIFPICDYEINFFDAVSIVSFHFVFSQKWILFVVLLDSESVNQIYPSCSLLSRRSRKYG